MGIETIVFIFAVIVIAAIWGAVRRARHAGGPNHLEEPSNDVAPRKNARPTRRDEP